MARRIRLHVPGVPAHVMSRGNNKLTIFIDDTDYEMYLEILSRILARFDVRCHGFCLMDNHTHLLLTPGAFPLSRMLQHLNSRYCQWFNRRHGRVGHVLQGRYLCLLVESPVYFLNALRYLALNPVVARRVTDPAEWPWSSYAATLGRVLPPDFLELGPVFTALDARDAGDASQRLASFVTNAETSGEPWERLFVGSRPLGARIEPMLEAHQVNHEFTYGDRFATRPSLSSLLGGVQPRQPGCDQAVHAAFCCHAYTLKEIGMALDRHPSTIWRWVRRANILQSG